MILFTRSTFDDATPDLTVGIRSRVQYLDDVDTSTILPLTFRQTGETFRLKAQAQQVLQGSLQEFAGASSCRLRSATEVLCSRTDQQAKNGGAHDYREKASLSGATKSSGPWRRKFSTCIGRNPIDSKTQETHRKKQAASQG